jgi:hypothetical protein
MPFRCLLLRLLTTVFLLEQIHLAQFVHAASRIMLLMGCLRSWQSLAFILMLLLASLISADACEFALGFSPCLNRYSPKTGLAIRFCSQSARIIHLLEKRLPLPGFLDAGLRGWI